MNKKNFILSCIYLLPVLLSAQSGNTFERTIGLPGYNYGTKALQTADSGYIILGNRSNFSGNNDIYLVKIDKQGNLIWDKTFGSYPVEWGSDLIISNDVHYLITGYTNQNSSNGYDVLLMKIDTAGNLKWMKTYGGQDWDFGFSLIELASGGFYITGETFSFGAGGGDVYLIRTDNNGDSLWTRTYGGIYEDAGLSIISLQYGNYLISGFTNSFGSGMSDCYVIKIDPDGDTIFTKCYGLAENDRVNAAVQNSNQEYIFVGFAENDTMLKDIYMFKTDTNGNKIEENFWGDTGNEEFMDMILGKDDAIIFTGYSTSYGIGGKDIFVFYFKDWGNFFGNTLGSIFDDESSSICLTMDNGYFIAGSTEGKGPDLSDIYVIKTDSLLKADPISIHITDIYRYIDAGDPLMIYPNPVSNELWIKTSALFSGDLNIRLYNILGQLQFETSEKIDQNGSLLNIKIPLLKNGYYLLSLDHREMKIMKKIRVVNKN